MCSDFPILSYTHSSSLIFCSSTYVSPSLPISRTYTVYVLPSSTTFHTYTTYVLHLHHLRLVPTPSTSFTYSTYVLYLYHLHLVPTPPTSRHHLVPHSPLKVLPTTPSSSLNVEQQITEEIQTSPPVVPQVACELIPLNLLAMTTRK